MPMPITRPLNQRTSTTFYPGALDRSGLPAAPALTLPPSKGMRDPLTGNVFHVASPVHIVTRG